MRTERRRFDHLIKRFRPQDKAETWETIYKFELNEDVELTLEDGSKIQTSRFMVERLKKRNEADTKQSTNRQKLNL